MIVEPPAIHHEHKQEPLPRGMPKSTAPHVPKRFEGTYKTIDPIDWTYLKSINFKEPNWAELYPLSAKHVPMQLLSPRMACKLFHDGVYILDKNEENDHFLQSRLPESAHKFYKKKQWKKQFVEAGRRICCRLAKGMNFSANSPAEECFVHILLREAPELGWRRIASIIDTLPESDKDKDFARVMRLAANEDIGYLFKTDNDPKEKVVDFQSWFKAFNKDESHMRDHML